MLATANAASAELFCVEKPPCTGGTEKPTLKAAVDAANATTLDARDRIEIGAGTIPFGGEAVAPADPDQGLEIVGSGRDATVLPVGSSGGDRLLTAMHPETLVSDLTVRMDTDETSGIRIFGGRLERVDVLGDAGTDSVAVDLRNGADATDVRALIGLGSASYGFDVTPATRRSDLVNVEARGFNGISVATTGDTVVRGARVTGRLALVTRAHGHIDADGVLVNVIGPDAVAVTASLFGGGPAQADTHVDLRHATLVGDGSPNQLAYDMENTSTSMTARESRIVGRDVVVSGIAKDARMSTSNNGFTELNLAYSTARRGPVEVTGGVPSSQETVDGPGLIAPPADPGLDGDFALRSSSPYVDAGEPGGLSGSQSPVDLLGAPRIADGNGDGTARRDVGAFEYQPPPPQPQGPGSATPPAGGGPASLLPPAARGPLFGRLRLLLPRSLRLNRRGRLVVPVLCPAGPLACAGRLEVATAARILARAAQRRRPRRRRRIVAIGRVSYRVAAGRRARLTIRVGPRNRALIRRRGRLRLVARATAADASSATRQAFTVRPARRARRRR
jgi:hypothetical protein